MYHILIINELWNVSQNDTTTAVALTRAAGGRGRSDGCEVGMNLDVRQVVSQSADAGTSDELTVVELDAL